MPANKKKIFDIFPPKEAQSLRAVVLPSGPNDKPGRPPRKKRYWSTSLVVLAAAVFVIILGAIGIYAKLLQARVELRPSQELAEVKGQVVVSVGTGGIDVSSNIIPGRILEDKQDLSLQFKSSGTLANETKAIGTIRIYNKYNLAQVLVANTRFLSDEGKLFRSKSRALIAPGEYQDVEVEASEGGESYNIGPSAFSVPGLAGSPRYTSVYGQSLSSMSGGGKSEAPQVTEEDIRSARESVANTLREEGRKKLQAKINSEEGVVFFEEAFLQAEEELESLAKSGDQTTHFNVAGSLVSRALIFSRQDLEQFVKNDILTNATLNMEINEKKAHLEFSFQEINWDERKMTVNFSASAPLYNVIDFQDIKVKIAGRSSGEGKTLLEAMSDIDSASINFWPIPATNIPKDTNRIKIDLKLD